MKEKLIGYLRQFVTERRIGLFEEKLDSRTRYITVVLEDIYQPHNASAVLRSCECFGVQDVHIIENHNKYQINPDVTLGANKWLTLHRHNRKEENTTETLESLLEQGYRLVATSPHTNDSPLEEFDLHKGKFALLFGSELEGLSSNALQKAAEFIRIPTVGFTESLNISVSAAICIHQLTQKLRNSSLNWHLTPEERQTLLLLWLKNSIRKSALIENNFLKDKNYLTDSDPTNSASASD